MDTKAIEKFSIEAREQLLKDVEQRLYIYGLDDAGRSEFGVEADAVRGTVLTATEKRQRTELFRRVEQEGTLPFITEMAYTWFNRFAAIRYMELHDFLPSHVRMLSAADGSFEPECLKAATTLDLPGLDRMEIAQLIQTGDDERLYRVILIAQCNELASFLPSVFGTVTADALTMPANLLRKNEFNALYRLVTDIPEGEWQDVEILGWMYQFYNSEVKAEFFKSKRKAAAEDIAPATQLFTPEWIVRYMVDNSLGRLWMLNHPESRLRDHARAENSSDRLMEYYIEPDEEHEDFIQVTSPEDITFCDPACGSGHILVYAFKMLMAIYEECGYREREIPELILTKNLSGFEIDPRAAQIATLALALCARKHDRRFFDRNITADITVLQDIEIDTDSLLLTSPLREKPELLENLAHLGEIGSLFQPSAEDIAALEADLIDAVGDNLFASHANSEVERALTTCRALARRFDVVVANPPYMGSGSFNPFMSKWVKKHHPDSCKDLCTAFIERGYALAEERGYSAMVTSQTWMFLSSFQALREALIATKELITLIDTRSTGLHADNFTANCSFVVFNGRGGRIAGTYFKLNQPIDKKATALLDAIKNPDCGYFYRADATTFHDIPGSPIAYWASKAVHDAFLQGRALSTVAPPRQGLATSDNNRFLRRWWETAQNHINFSAESREEAKLSKSRWFPIIRGGDYRKWYGNLSEVVDWREDGKDMKAAVMAKYPYLNNPNFVIKNPDCYFSQAISWSKISSGRIAFRFEPKGMLFEVAGPCIFSDSNTLSYLLGLTNSSVIQNIAAILSPTLNYEVGQIASYPVLNASSGTQEQIEALVNRCRNLSKSDWDSQETSWDFKQNALV